MRSGHYFEVLPCNFNGTIRHKMRFGHNIWLEGPIDLDQRVSTAFCKIFSGTPHSTIFGAPKYTYLAYLAIFHSYSSNCDAFLGLVIWLSLVFSKLIQDDKRSTQLERGDNFLSRWSKPRTAPGVLKVLPQGCGTESRQSCIAKVSNHLFWWIWKFCEILGKYTLRNKLLKYQRFMETVIKHEERGRHSPE